MKNALSAALLAIAALLAVFVGTGATTHASAAATPALQPTPAFAWRDMFREFWKLREETPTVDLSKEFPGLSVDMARLGEAFARTAYSADFALGRKNFHTLVRNLGMESPGTKDLCQFLHPNKKPWPEYTGPTDGNFHMLFNTGTLNLDTSDGSSKTHPAKKLAREHLGFFTSQMHVKALTQTLSVTVRAQKADTAAALSDDVKRATLLEAFKATWKAKFPKESLSGKDLRFVTAMLPYVG